MLTVFNCIIFPKNLGSDSQLWIVQFTQDVVKICSQCEKYKMDFYPELSSQARDEIQRHVYNIDLCLSGLSGLKQRHYFYFQKLSVVPKCKKFKIRKMQCWEYRFRFTQNESVNFTLEESNAVMRRF